jgi:ribose transport system substrate-binding protein
MASLNTQSRKHARKQQIRPLAGSLLALAIGFGVATAHADDALPKLVTKTPLKVGFAQTESNNPWRLAETRSFKDVAAKCGW